jgi:hypothetical protein
MNSDKAFVIESTFLESGLYVGVDHCMAHLLTGGAFAVLATNNSTATDNPVGTWVPPKGSSDPTETPTGMPRTA